MKRFNYRGLHAHRCVGCKTVWEHPTCKENIDNDKAHTCPTCGLKRFFKEPLKGLKIDVPYTGDVK